MRTGIYHGVKHYTEVKQHHNSSPVCFTIFGMFVTRSSQLYFYYFKVLLSNTGGKKNKQNRFKFYKDTKYLCFLKSIDADILRFDLVQWTQECLWRYRPKRESIRLLNFCSKQIHEQSIFLLPTNEWGKENRVDRTYVRQFNFLNLKDHMTKNWKIQWEPNRVHFKITKRKSNLLQTNFR